MVKRQADRRGDMRFVSRIPLGRNGLVTMSILVFFETEIGRRN